MRVLIDENFAHDLVEQLPSHNVLTVQQLGWAGLKNGELLRRASGQFDAFLTMDANLEHQQPLSSAPFGILIIHARTNRMMDLRPLITAIIDTLTILGPGEIRRVGR